MIIPERIISGRKKSHANWLYNGIPLNERKYNQYIYAGKRKKKTLHAYAYTRTCKEATFGIEWPSKKQFIFEGIFDSFSESYDEVSKLYDEDL